MDNAKRIILQKFAHTIAQEVPISPAIERAFSQIPRELFVPPGFNRWAYRTEALPMASAQWISSPITVAKMTHYLQPEGADNVLEIGCGSGYQAAILSKLFRRVFTIERIAKLFKEAKMRFEQLELHNIHARLDDGQRGWRQYAPYDRILFSASITQIPSALFEQLAEGGILVAPIVTEAEQNITRFHKHQGKIKQESLERCQFVPVKHGIDHTARD